MQKSIERRWSVTDGRRVHLPILQPLFEYASVRSIVIDDQHPKVMDCALRSCGRLRSWLRLTAECCSKSERTANVWLTLNRDPSVHERHQACRDRQSQTSPAVFTRRRGVLLLEGAKDSLLIVARNADTRVTHRK